MYRGSVAVDSTNTYIYISPYNSSQVYKYTMQQDKWTQLQNCPYQDCALVVKNNYLLSVGGRTSIYGDPTKKLFQLQGEKWEEHSIMNFARSCCAAISVSDYLIVIGGYGQLGHRIASVEILDNKTKKWSHLRDLPCPLDWPSATISGKQLYVLSGGYDGEGYCSSPIGELSTSNGPPPALTWTPIPQSPVNYSTIATLSGVPVLVGGRVRGRGPPVLLSTHCHMDSGWSVAISVRLGLPV